MAPGNPCNFVLIQRDHLLRRNVICIQSAIIPDTPLCFLRKWKTACSITCEEYFM